MPYEVSFKKRLTVGDRAGEEEYFNDCCWGGDVIGKHLEPLVARNYQRVKVEQEDWGWYLWFEKNGVGLEINIMCDDEGTGQFRIHLVSTEGDANSMHASRNELRAFVIDEPPRPLARYSRQLASQVYCLHTDGIVSWHLNTWRTTVQIERRFRPDDILTIYANSAYFGN